MATISEALAIAIEHHQAGRLQNAEQIYRQILEVDPDHAEALHLLGVIAHQSGRHEQAIEQIERAIRLNGGRSAFHSNLGEAYRAVQDLPAAIACFRRALQIDPLSAKAVNNLGIALKDQEQLVEAIDCFQQALRIKPDYAEACYNLGTALAEQGQRAEAIRCYQQALQLKPDYGDAYNNLGNLWFNQGQFANAMTCYEQALALQPNLARTHYNLGNTRKEQGRFLEAIACYRRALELNPDHAAALGELIHRLQHVCLWTELADLERRALESLEQPLSGGGVAGPLTPFCLLTFATPPTTAAQQQSGARRWVEQRFAAEMKIGQQASPRVAVDPLSKITVGYLSTDFRAHPVGYQIAELIEKHDRRRFNIYGYSYGNDDDSEIRRRLVSGFDRFVDLHDAATTRTAEQIAADGVQILVDLTGHTGNTRTGIPAVRPAPIQVNYLGYPGTLGAPFMDYILVDDFVVPSDRQPYFSEQLVHLPGCFLVTDSQREVASRTPTRAECGLPETGFVFCSFNNSYKIAPEMFDVWMELLRDVPESVLWLSESNVHVPVNLRREATARGVAPDRLVFAPRLPAAADHLARYRVADLFLDTYPYNAHATASDALWAGCPVLTRVGETFPSRVAGSLLRTIGLPELITSGRDEYREQALRLARDRELLAGVRSRLEANRRTSSLFDTDRFARNLERAFTNMWKTHCRGAKACAFRVEEPVDVHGR